jgi:hypothetical protein
MSLPELFVSWDWFCSQWNVRAGGAVRGGCFSGFLRRQAEKKLNKANQTGIFLIQKHHCKDGLSVA